MRRVVHVMIDRWRIEARVAGQVGLGLNTEQQSRNVNIKVGKLEKYEKEP